LPDMGDKTIVDAEDRKGKVSSEGSKSHALLQALASTDDSLVKRTANLFQIYPMQVVSKRGAVPDWKIKAYEINIKSQAYLATALKKFSEKNTKDAMVKWFGKASYADMPTRTELERVMNAVSAMLGSVEYVYDASQCGPRTYAFVYPRVIGSVVQNCYDTEPSEGEKCVQNSEGKFMFFLCDVYMNSGEAEQIETLLHEGSHHAASYTTDVCVNEFYLGNSEPFFKTIPLADVEEMGKSVGDSVWVPLPKYKVKDTYTEVGGDVMFKFVEIVGDKAKLRVMDDFDDCMNSDAHVAYGRSVCKALAKLDPRKALKNADNFCYYVLDVMTENGAADPDKDCTNGHGGHCVGDRVELYSSQGYEPGMVMFPVKDPYSTAGWGWGNEPKEKCTVKLDGRHKNQEVSCGSLTAS